MTFDDLTWPCMICGEERPDCHINVWKHDRSALMNLPPGTLMQNVRYCNDRPACVAAAAKFEWNGPTLSPPAKA